MNRIDQRFAELKERGEKALIPFLTVGDPDLDTTVDIILRLEEAGADVIELGVPYSDPLADGPVIQRSSQRALTHQVTILDCIRTASACRKRGSQLPFILFTYYNPVLQLGLDHFFETIAEHDISGLIIPDLPIEESGPVRERAQAYQIHLIPLVAPTSRERIQQITSQAAGFLYCVSSLGVTGTRSEFYDGLQAFVDSVKQATDLPVAIGFGISNREQALQMASISDGVVVGSAIVRQIEEAMPLLSQAATREEGLLQIRDFVRQLKA
ncbi:tryptophan synthase alpha chain [Paenibacillus sp. J31TS4]|uniref:tryptophan synthase subunit alpha n=1 Tax=Paenibacillus sp. J31TS4 TaxID=2807195 RepID=UPI001B282F6C|nr:tryptophan synthase subunit alpha [Paenibacillus sp. J31TS4]GIP37458.1 tryptophan synthase alpha chain [Paenibacillus sp. J31TS4]